ncbi:hypothetical protein EUTSA_v100157311mg, partial [Eutrema salsugineum]
MFVKRNPIRGVSAGKSSSPPPPPVNVAVAHIRVGSYYEIDSSILPQRSPEQLKSIRVVMVGKITASDVSLRYPSMYSLRSHFDSGGGNRTKLENSSGGSLLPVLDESHVVSAELAGDLLYRRIAPHEVSVNRNSWGFWVSSASRRSSNLSRRETVSQPAYNTRLCRAISPEGNCWSELRSRGMIKWGKRLRVRYQSRNKEENSRMKDEEEDEELRKRAKVYDQKKENQIVVYKKGKVSDQKKDDQIVVYKRRTEKKFIDRWSVERYKLAEKN